MQNKIKREWRRLLGGWRDTEGNVDSGRSLRISMSNRKEETERKRQDEEKKRKKEEVEEMKQDEVGLSMYISSLLLHPLHVHFLSFPKDTLLFTDCIISFLLLFTPSNRRQHNNQPLLFSGLLLFFFLAIVVLAERSLWRINSLLLPVNHLVISLILSLFKPPPLTSFSFCLPRY